MQIDRLCFRFGIRDPLVASTVSALANEVRRPGERAALFADHLADVILLHLLRTGGGGSPERADPREARGGLSSRALRRVRDKIEASLATGSTLEELAREAGLSRAHFARAFRTSTGVPPHQFLISRRIERAKERLRHSDEPLADIALEVGFSSQAHFTEQFRRSTGLTPLRFRRETRSS